MNKINLISLVLLLPIVGGAIVLISNQIPSYNIAFISLITISAIIITVINFFNKSVVEKEVEVIVEKKVYIESKSDNNETIIKSTDLENAVNLIDDIDEQTNQEEYINTQLSKIANSFNLDQIVFYLKQENNIYKILGKYALTMEDSIAFSVGEGLSGQAVKDKKSLYLTDIPEGYITIISGLGNGNPKSLFIVPAFYDDEVIGLAEFASLREIDEAKRELIEIMLEKIAINLVNVK